MTARLRSRAASAGVTRAPAGPPRARRAALPLLLLLAVLRSAAGFAGPFTASARYSAGKVAPLRESPPLNASAEADLDVIAATRSYEGELVFFQFESHRHRWLNFALNMAAQLTAVGYHHYVALAGFPVDCDRLHARWRELYADATPGPGGAHPQPACAVAALPLHGESGSMEFHGFWAGRYAFLTSMVERRVNPMLLDLDFAIHYDMYADLAEPCMANGTMMMLGEGGGPNAGFVYIRDAHPDGAAHWVVAQIKRRVDLFFAERDATGKLPGNTWEQDILKDATRIALAPNGSHWDFGTGREASHPFWTAHPQEGYSREYVTTSVPINATLSCPAEARFNTTGAEGLRNLVGGGGRQHSLLVLTKPADAPGAPSSELPREFMLYVPSYFMQYGNIVNAAWNNDKMPSALTHMLKTSGTWLPSTADVDNTLSHVTRMAAMQAFGYWAPELLEVEAASKPLMYLKDSLVAAASAHADVGRLRELVARALHAAALTERVLVLPQLPCDSPWLRRSNDTNGHGGVADNRVFVVPRTAGAGVDCYVGAHSYEFCWPWDHVVYAFDPIVLRRRAAAPTVPWERAKLLPNVTSGDVVVNHLPYHAVTDAAMPLDQGMLKHLETDCRDIFAGAAIVAAAA
jgi:hypothetical protein